MAARKRSPRAELEREIGLRGTLAQFVEIAWPIVEPSQPLIWSWGLGAQCEHYEAIERQQIKTLVVNIPPGMSKSRMSGVYWPVWAWINELYGNIGLSWGHFSYDPDNTFKQNYDSLELMNSQWFRERWGDIVTFKERDPATGDYYNTLGGRRFASSVEGKAIGKHFHRQVIDDPLKPKGISPVTLEGAKKWLSGTMATRWLRGPTWTARSLVMQRLHEDDTTAQVLAMDKNAVHLMLPMEYESGRASKTYVDFGAAGAREAAREAGKKYVPEKELLFVDGPEDKTLEGYREPEYRDGKPIPNTGTRFSGRKDENELLAPNFMTEEVVEVLKADLTMQERAAQLQQNPKAAGGNVFKDENFRFWITSGTDTSAFEQAVPPRRFTLLPQKFDRMWQSWDFTFKDLATSDFVCGQVWGQYQADFFLVWQVLDRLDFAASVKAIKQVTLLFPRARKKLIEDKANGTAIMNALKGRMFGIEPVEPEGGKDARASACSPIFESGNVYIPAPSMPGFAWSTAYMEQMTTFPYAKKDDQVDATSQALNWGSSKQSRFAAAMKKLQADNPAGAHLRHLLTRIQ